MIINGLIPFLCNIFATRQAVRGQEECDFSILGQWIPLRLLKTEERREQEYTYNACSHMFVEYTREQEETDSKGSTTL